MFKNISEMLYGINIITTRLLLTLHRLRLFIIRSLVGIYMMDLMVIKLKLFTVVKQIPRASHGRVDKGTDFKFYLAIYNVDLRIILMRKLIYQLDLFLC